MATKSWGDWENLGPIAEGGASHVFKVKHASTGQIGALKRLKNSNRRERFRKEIETPRVLQHIGIVPLLDFNLQTEPYYAVYEFEPGGSLGKIPTDELLSLPVQQRISWCMQLCDVLMLTHAGQIVHRDIKPENILISEDRKTVRLCDFGLVYFDENGERQTGTMEQIGSRFYIPPELEQGHAEEVVSASDMYSLGKVIYYIFAGKIYARERHREPGFDLAKIYNNPQLEAISRIIDQVVTTDWKIRLTADMVHNQLRAAGDAITERRPIAGILATYKCVFCGTGTYRVACTTRESHNEGYKEGNIGEEHMVFLECTTCGNCQRFKLKYGGNDWFADAVKASGRSFRPQGFM